MKKIYEESRILSQHTGWSVSKIFLMLNTVLWALLSCLCGAVILSLTVHTLAGYGSILFCAAGYGGIFVGFFGGSLYWYRFIGNDTDIAKEN